MNTQYPIIKKPGHWSMRTMAILATILLALLAAQAFLSDSRLAAWPSLNPHAVRLSLSILAWMFGAVLACRLVEALGWSQVGRKTGKHAPQLLVQLSNVVIYITAALGMAGFLFDVPLTGAIATSSVIGLVLGFAVKSLISDTFSGIALNLDQGFTINDFIQLLGKGGTTRISGRVIQINWRSTYLMTPENSVMVVPNTIVSESIVLNFSKPESAGEFELPITLDFEIPSDRAVRVLTAAVNAAARETSVIWDCKVRISELNSNGITYKIKYMLDPARMGPGKAKALILGHVVRQLKVTGLALAHPKLDNWSRETPELDHRLGDINNRLALLRKVDLFAQFEEPELRGLAERMRLRQFAAATNVITVAEPGRSMYILSEGLTAVRVKGSDGEVDVATLSPGDFFGEMSLLTGEPRSASIFALTETVAFEIDKDDLMPLLDSNPQAAEMLSSAVAARRVASAAGSSKQVEAVAADRASIAAKIFKGMMRFFGRGEATPALESA